MDNSVTTTATQGDEPAHVAVFRAGGNGARGDLRWGWPFSWVGSPLRVGLFVAVFLTGSGNVALYDNISSGFKLYFQISLYIIGAAFLFHPKFKDYSIAIIAMVLSINVWFAVPRTDFTSGICVAYAAYLISAHSPAKIRKLWLAWLLVGLGLAFAHLPFDFDMFDTSTGGIKPSPDTAARDWFFMLGFFTLSYALIGFFWLWGVIDRRKFEREELVRQRAEMAATVERTRIAREMHDIVAHNLAGIMALADGARYAAAKDPSVAIDALETISAQSRASLSQMRGLLSVLREENSRDLTAAPGREELATLFAEARRKEVNVDVVGLDTVPKDMSELAQFTLYRVVQELLTNIMRHSADRRGTIRFDAGDGELVVTASNLCGGDVGVADVGGSGAPGFGLVGISERLKAHGGKLDVSTSDGMFVAVAKLPTAY